MQSKRLIKELLAQIFFQMIFAKSLRRQHELLRWARRREHTAEFKERYAKRAGIEGTISQGTRSFGLRRSRVERRLVQRLERLGYEVALQPRALAN